MHRYIKPNGKVYYYHNHFYFNYYYGSGFEVCNEALQLLGGYGYLKVIMSGN